MEFLIFLPSLSRQTVFVFHISISVLIPTDYHRLPPWVESSQVLFLYGLFSSANLCHLYWGSVLKSSNEMFPNLSFSLFYTVAHPGFRTDSIWKRARSGLLEGLWEGKRSGGAGRWNYIIISEKNKEFLKEKLNPQKKSERIEVLILFSTFSLMFKHKKEDSYLHTRIMVLPRIQIFRYIDVDLPRH